MGSIGRGHGGGIQGVVLGLARDGVVLEFEHRRKSGREVQEWFYLPLREAAKGKEMATAKVRAALFEKVGVQPRKWKS